MCPIWPFHLIIIFLLALFPMRLLVEAIPQFTALFDPSALTVNMDEHYYVNVTFEDLNNFNKGDTIHILSENKHIASTDFSYSLLESDIARGIWSSTLKVYGHFLGFTDVRASIRTPIVNVSATEVLRVTVIRPNRVIDTIFTASVATFVSLIFVNFGCAMHWPTVKDVLKKPIGPAIGVTGNFLLMPLLSFGLGLLLFPNNPTMRLGMFFSGITPGGGSSNIWTFILKGNLNLSLAMTTISTFLAFGLMPAWLFSLGQVIFADAEIVVPYGRIAMFVFALVVPLAIGLAMQKFTPKIAAFMVRILKAMSIILLLFIIVFAILTNLYIFELFTWQIYVAGMGIPWIGYISGYVVAWLLRQPHADRIAICIEVGNQNTGISIFLLRYALEQPAADLTTVIPVSVAIMTPLPMMLIYTIQRIRGCVKSRREKEKDINEEELAERSGTPEQSRSLATVDPEADHNNDRNK